MKTMKMLKKMFEKDEVIIGFRLYLISSTGCRKKYRKIILGDALIFWGCVLCTFKLKKYPYSEIIISLMIERNSKFGTKSHFKIKKMN